MRKKVISQSSRAGTRVEEGWLNPEELAQVEVSSEASGHPIESALLLDAEGGWRAAERGPQTIRLIFDDGQQIRRIRLRFVETEVERTQEFVLRWSADSGQSFLEIVRQQWNFSPHGATEEVEDYHVSLSGLSVLELTITPNKNERSDTRASLASLRLA